MAPVLAAALLMSGCAKTLPVAEPAPPPAASQPREQARHEEQGPQDAARKIVVARVNGVELSMDALVRMMNNLPEKPGGPENLEERKKRALDSLVLLELAHQRAAAQGLFADPVRVELTMDNYKQEFGDREFAGYLARLGMTEAEFRAEIERGLAINLIYTAEVTDAITIPEEELRKEYERDKEPFIQPEKVSVVDVYLTTDEGKASWKKAEELLKTIKAEPAQDPWRLVLDGTFLVRKAVVRQDREKELYEAAKRLKPQELSGVIRTPKGLHIIKLIEYSPLRLLTFEEAKPKIEAKLRGPYQDRKTKEWEEELKKDARIELLPEAAEQPQEKKHS
jgi:parvulin-like peptidyl-prolyl isomerase